MCVVCGNCIRCCQFVMLCHDVSIYFSLYYHFWRTKVVLYPSLQPWAKDARSQTGASSCLLPVSSATKLAPLRTTVLRFVVVVRHYMRMSGTRTLFFGHCFSFPITVPND